MEVSGTGKIIQISIDSTRDIPMQDLDFTLEFYVNPNKRKVVKNSELVRQGRRDGTYVFYARLDTRSLGKGHLMCRIRIQDPEGRWEGGYRPVILERNTGIGIGGAMDLPSYSLQTLWVEGYKIDFNTVWSMPKPEIAYIYYGKIVDHISDFSDITPEMLRSSQNTILSISSKQKGAMPIRDINAGDKVVVLVPFGFTATKDNGIGGKVPFDTSVMGCNGEKTMFLDGITYRIFGELMTIGGELFIYVD